MAVNLAIPQLDKNSTTKDYVVTILSYDWPLTIKKLHSLIKKRYAKSVSYQAVYKVVHELVDQEVLQRTTEGYQIDLKWLKRVHGFTELVETNYYTKSRLNTIEGLKDSRSEGGITVLTFQTWFDVEKYLYYLQKHSVLSSPKKLDICVHHKHDWRPLFYLRAEYNWCRKLKEMGHGVHFLCAGSSAIDSWSAQFYRKLGVDVKNSVRCAETCELMVYDDAVIQIFVPADLSTALDHLCKTSQPSDVDVPSVIKNIFEKQADIKVVINRDRKLAEQLISQTVSQFKR
ncbi:hypothetical protein HY642_07130 [Candidatus Woesearchaeota archaeon]|nr:hypothetical protein [Candidatus Woesearchaeota archaeon]